MIVYNINYGKTTVYHPYNHNGTNVTSSATVFKIQSYIESTSGTADFGVASNVSTMGANIYTVVKITKIG